MKSASNDTYLSLSTASRAGALQAVMAAVEAGALLLPIGASRLDVNETLYRLDASPAAPSLDRGVLAVNRVGEPLATLSMRWSLAPDDFVATATADPPDTPFRSRASQRVVMQSGSIAFRDRGESGLRFFGTGRTYPATTDGRPRLMFAGTAVIVEGVGTLKGTRGTLLISGELTSPSMLSLTVTGRLEAGSPVRREDVISPMIERDAAEPASTIFTLLGESGGPGAPLRALRVGNDVGTDGRLRGSARVGDVVGSAAGAVVGDPSDVRRSVPLEGARRQVAFTDPLGRVIGTIECTELEASACTDAVDGRAVRRIAAYGPATNGTGALAGAGGVLLVDAPVDGDGAPALYTLRLADPAGRFRMPAEEPSVAAAPATPVDAPAPRPATAVPLAFVPGRSGLLTGKDRDIVALADRTLARGADLQRWWERHDAADDYQERFEVVHEYTAGDRTFGFFDEAPSGDGDGRMPVMGVVQEMFYDRQKAATPEQVREQLREFVLRYFMRISERLEPVPVGDAAMSGRPAVERAMSWRADEGERKIGFGYSQLYYKRKDSGRIGKFTSADRDAVADLREIGTVYDWIVLKVNINHFQLAFAPFGADALQMLMPLKESSYLVIGPPFMRNQDKPAPGVLAEFGFGYAFMPYVPEDAPPMLAFGPGYFADAIKNVVFRVMDDGEVRLRAAFVVNRPDRITKVDLAPVNWGLAMADKLSFGTASRLLAPVKSMAERLPLRMNDVDPLISFISAANSLTGGLAGRRYGISKVTLEKRMLVQHFMQHHELFTASLLAWRRVPDWTDRANLPANCGEEVPA